jgi:hypothetical protein
MARRLYRDAEPALRNTRFNTEAEKLDAERFLRRREEQGEAEVNKTMTAERERLSGDVDGLRDRYGDQYSNAKKLQKLIDNGELTYDEAGARADELRARLEHLDALPPSLQQREDTIADAMEDPLGFLDRMCERAHTLRRPEYPW